MTKIIRENFESIHQLLTAIKSRPNNQIMKSGHSSEIGDYNFTKTNNFQEAEELFKTGYTEILPQIKTGLDKNIETMNVENRRRIKTGVFGYAPHVPNAILGLPNSMILTESQPQKVKTISIVVEICENWTVKAEEFIKSGIAALSVINTLELKGYRVALKVAFFSAKEGNEYAFATVKVKDYREHMDLQKLCFPLAHPSMFRRFGFKWLETCSGLTNSSWMYGYGHQINENSKVRKEFLEENEFFINLKVTKECNYDPNKIIERLLKG